MEHLSPIQAKDKKEVFVSPIRIVIYQDSSPGRWIVGFRKQGIATFQGTDSFVKVPEIITSMLMEKCPESRF